MLDSDLALLYEIETKVLNQAVKRNLTRFPADFMFQLTEEEWRTIRLQSGIFKKGIIPRVISRIRPGTIINNFVNDHCSTLLFSKYYSMIQSPLIKMVPLDPPCKSTVILAYKKTGKKNKSIERLITYMAESFPCL